MMVRVKNETTLIQRMAAEAYRDATPAPSEAIEQTRLFQWVRMQSGAMPELCLLYHIPNGGNRHKREAANLKLQGVRAGVPDLCLPVAREGCHGLYIELKKSKGGRVSVEQTQWMDALMHQGYRVALCHGWEQAADVLEKYLRAKAGDVDAQYQ